MTKQQLIARLTREPIVVQQIATLARYRISLHGDRDRSGGVWLGLVRVAGPLLVEDYAEVHARVNGRVVFLAEHETDVIVSRLRRFFVRGGHPVGTGMRPREHVTARRPGSARTANLRTVSRRRKRRSAGNTSAPQDKRLLR